MGNNTTYLRKRKKTDNYCYTGNFRFCCQANVCYTWPRNNYDHFRNSAGGLEQPLPRPLLSGIYAVPMARGHKENPAIRPTNRTERSGGKNSESLTADEGKRLISTDRWPQSNDNKQKQFHLQYTEADPRKEKIVVRYGNKLVPLREKISEKWTHFLKHTLRPFPAVSKGLLLSPKPHNSNFQFLLRTFIHSAPLETEPGGNICILIGCRRLRRVGLTRSSNFMSQFKAAITNCMSLSFKKVSATHPNTHTWPLVWVMRLLYFRLQRQPWNLMLEITPHVKCKCSLSQLQCSSASVLTQEMFPMQWCSQHPF